MTPDAHRPRHGSGGAGTPFLSSDSTIAKSHSQSAGLRYVDLIADDTDHEMLTAWFVADLIADLGPADADNVRKLVVDLAELAVLIPWPSDRADLVAVARAIAQPTDWVGIELRDCDGATVVAALPLRAWCAEWIARPFLAAVAGQPIDPMPAGAWLVMIGQLLNHAEEVV